jgi:hypothetical protein
VILYPDSWTREVLDLVDLPMSYKVYLACISIANLACSYAFEKLFIAWFSKEYNSRREIQQRKNVNRVA